MKRSSYFTCGYIIEFVLLLEFNCALSCFDILERPIEPQVYTVMIQTLKLDAVQFSWVHMVKSTGVLWRFCTQVNIKREMLSCGPFLPNFKVIKGFAITSAGIGLDPF